MAAAYDGPVRVMDFRGTFKGGGGPDKTILNSAARHDPQRVDILVTYLRDPVDRGYIIDQWAARLGVRYIDVPDRTRFDFACIKQVKELIDRNKIQLLHAHDDKTLLYGWIIKKICPGLSVMYTCHSHSIYGRQDFDCWRGYLGFYLRCKAQVFLMKRFQKPILTIAAHTRRSLVMEGMKEEDVEVLPNGIDTDEWHPARGKPVLRKELGLRDTDFLVGTVARIDYLDKDLPTFYRVAADIVTEMPNVKFVIVGDGERDVLTREKERVAAMGLGQCLCFTGHRTDLADVYASFDVFLMTSRSEGMPNTVLEAMAMEVPVVSTRVGGVPEIIANDSMGLLAPVADVQTLSDHVRLLLDDPVRRRQVARAGRRRIEEAFSFEGRVRAMEEYYRRFVYL